MERIDTVGSLLEHVEILARNVTSLKIADKLSLATQEGAEASVITINEMREKVLAYQKTARLLKNALENSYHLVDLQDTLNDFVPNVS